jgi:hypothetical protein
MRKSGTPPGWPGSCADFTLGNVGRGKWMVGATIHGLTPVANRPAGRTPPLPCETALGRFGGKGARFGAVRSTVVTWLILPVVICLSQRLSHACLSISNYTVKLRMAH